MILNRDLVVSMEAKCNQLVCHDCGKNHAVHLDVSGDVVIPRYSGENICCGFKEQVNALLKTEITRHMMNPFPWQM